MGRHGYRIYWRKHGRYRYIGGGHGELIGAARALEVGRRVGYSVAVGIHHRQPPEAVARIGREGEGNIVALE